jgi:hypothetical protein
MLIYHYAPATGEFSESAPARIAPLRENLPDSDVTKFLCPAHATFIAPPKAAKGKAAIFSDGAWLLVEDHRDAVGWVAGVETTIAALGPLPAGWSANAPAEVLEQAANRETLVKIATLEAGQHRTIREATLGVAGGMDRLKVIDAKIATLRATLK